MGTEWKQNADLDLRPSRGSLDGRGLTQSRRKQDERITQIKFNSFHADADDVIFFPFQFPPSSVLSIMTDVKAGTRSPSEAGGLAHPSAIAGPQLFTGLPCHSPSAELHTSSGCLLSLPSLPTVPAGHPAALCPAEHLHLCRKQDSIPDGLQEVPATGTRLTGRANRTTGPATDNKARAGRCCRRPLPFSLWSGSK